MAAPGEVEEPHWVGQVLAGFSGWKVLTRVGGETAGASGPGSFSQVSSSWVC